MVALSPAFPASVRFDDVDLSIIDRDGKPWLLGVQIGAALGYGNPRIDIANLFKRNKVEFGPSETCVCTLPTQGQRRQVRLFSARGAWLLAMLARTGVARRFRRWVLDTLEKLADQKVDPAIPRADGRYLVHVVGGRVNLVTDVRDACIVNGSNPVNVMTFLREYLDPAVFPVALETIAYRASVCLKYGPKGAPVPSIFRAPGPSHEARVLSIIRTAGRISRTDLLMKMKHHLKAAELDRVLTALERDGRIRVDTPSPPIGRPPFWYAAA